VVRVGFEPRPLQADNYSKSVIDGYNLVKEDFMSSTPAGRIGLLDGPPGTGKTFLIRSLITEVSGNFVIVNPSQYSDLMSPEFITPFLEFVRDNASNYSFHPTILILEDADKLLLPREEGVSLEGLSSILNMGDGLMSDAFDIRLLVTTNSPLSKIDPAILRKGRLSARLETGPLSDEHATFVLHRLVEDCKEVCEEDMVLGDIYAKAREIDEKKADKG